MKPALSVLAVSALATPALAHSGAHMHPHSIEGWVVGLGVVLAVVATTVAAKGRK